MQKSAMRSLSGMHARLPSQMLRVMRMTTFFLLAVSLSLSARTSSQTISFSGKEASLEKVFSVIRQQSGFSVFYNLELLARSKPVTLHVTAMPLPDFLELALKDQPFSFHFAARTIVLSEKKPLVVALTRQRAGLTDGAVAFKGRVTDVSGAAVPNAIVSVRGSSFSARADAKGHFLLSAETSVQAGQPILLEVSAFGFYSQEVIVSENGSTVFSQPAVTGRVTDSEGVPLEGATIAIRGKSVTAVTDQQGRFVIAAASGDVLIVSFIGFVAREITVSEQQNLSIMLTEDIAHLQDVVVVGYGTQKKINLTGAVDVIDNQYLQNRPVVNTSQMLQGLAPGMTLSLSNSGFQPGAPMAISLRGVGSINGGGAYILIDNVPGDPNQLNPTDIESISVLKDASAAAIYGARAPYGVILITTKSGKRSEKVRVDFSNNVSLAKMSRLPSHVDSYTYALAMNEAGRNGGGIIYNNETIDRIIAYQQDPTLPETVPDPTNPAVWGWQQFSNSNHNWIDHYYGGHAFRNQSNLSVSGGTASSAYFLSAGYVSEPGVINYAKDDYKRYNLSANVDLDIAKWWKLGSRTRYSSDNRAYPTMSNEGGYGLLFHQIVRTQPTEALRTPNGRYTRLSKMMDIMDMGGIRNQNNELIQRFTTEISPFKGFRINADYSLQQSNRQITQVQTTAYMDRVDGSLEAITVSIPSYIIRTAGNTFYNTSNVYATYDFTVRAQHTFSLLAGYQLEYEKWNQLEGRQNDLLSSDFPSISTSTGDIQVSDAVTHWATEGSFFRIKYNYNDKYLLEANGRYDGTSRFSEGNRYGFFPSFSAGWNISREPFWESLANTVSLLKLRSSWGQLGNQNVAAYQDLAFIGVATNLPWIVNGMRPVYTTAPSLTSSNLSWETSETFNVGIDLGMLDNRLELHGDWYQRLTRDMIGPAEALPVTLGANVPQTNNATMRTRGWELSVSWQDRIGDHIRYYVNANLSDNRSVILDFFNPTKILTTYRQGQTIGEIWGYETAGLFGSQDEIDKHANQNFFFGSWNPGDVKYADLNQDGVINQGANTFDNPGDKRIIGNTQPRYQFGLNMGISVKGFDFSMLWTGVGKRDITSAFIGRANLYWGFDVWNQSSLFTHHMDYYRDAEADKYIGLGTNTNSFFPRPYLGAEGNKNKVLQTRYLQNGAFARLKNLQVGYTFSESVLQTLRLRTLRVFFSGENLWTLTSVFKGFDPETAMLGDYGAGKSYLPQTNYAFGLNVSF